MSRPFLFVIARGHTKRYDLANRHFGDEQEVEIVYDRRVGERRASRASEDAEAERRLKDRRGYDISLSGWAYIRRAGSA
jgi:hypothetical protein